MASKFYKFARGLVKPFVWGIFRVKVLGKENLGYTGRMIMASNHRGLLDTLLIACDIQHQLRPMAKKELFESKLGNKLFTALGAFPIDRGKGDIDAIRAAGKVLQEGGTLIVFPEGTRNRDKKEWSLMEFKNGTSLIAIRNDTAILPVCIATIPKAFRKNYVVFGKPISYQDVMDPELDKSENTRRLTKAVQQSVQQMHDMVMEKYY